MARSRVIAGIDIGSSKVATLIGQYNEEEDKISVVGVSSVASRGVRKGQIVDIEEAAGSVVESVEAAERMAGYNLDHAFVTIGGAHIESQNSHGVVAVADPSGEIDGADVERVIEAARAISLPEAREILHVLPREYKVDGETLVADPEGMSGVRLETETHLITGSSTAIKNIHKCLSEAGINVDGMAFSGLAASFSALTETEKELGVVLVDIGGGTTSVAVFLEGALVHSFVLPIGGRNVTNDVAAGLRISLDGAEKLKILLSEKSAGEVDEDELSLSSLGIDEPDRKVSRKTLTEGIMRPRLNEIFTMVGIGLKEAEVIGKTPSGIVITGGGALCVGAVEAARRMLSLPAKAANPTGVSGLIDEIKNPAFAASVGLLLYGTKIEITTGGWPGGGILSKIEQIPVRGLVGKASEIIKNLLP